jgi:hypothetical protein
MRPRLIDTKKDNKNEEKKCVPLIMNPSVALGPSDHNKSEDTKIHKRLGEHAASLNSLK